MCINWIENYVNTWQNDSVVNTAWGTVDSLEDFPNLICALVCYLIWFVGKGCCLQGLINTNSNKAKLFVLSTSLYPLQISWPLPLDPGPVYQRSALQSGKSHYPSVQPGLRLLVIERERKRTHQCHHHMPAQQRQRGNEKKGAWVLRRMTVSFFAGLGEFCMVWGGQ